MLLRSSCALLLAVTVSSTKAFVPRTTKAAMSSTAARASADLYSLTGERGDGSTLDASSLKGKVVYATNVASRCGLTSREYARFERLGKHGDALAILAFPSQEFGGQEFGDDGEIAAFAEKKNFPDNGTLMKLGSVVGDTAPELWKCLRESAGAGDPSWNFGSKFLVSKDGKVTVPDDVDADVEKLISE